MINRFLLATLVAAGSLQAPFAQDNDPVLFTVEDQAVHVSEFDYIYGKTGGEEASYSEESLREYLELYINFKLKVRKAREMGLDTIPSLQKELAGYRRQLADSYLMDREVTDKLVGEAYERQKQDVDIGHILFRIPANAGPEAEANARAKANAVLEEIRQGLSFEEAALTYSEDPSAKTNKGRIGFLTALFPSGFYELETAAYTLPVGEAGGPYRTRSGYHLLEVHGKRPAYGEVEVAHLLIRKKKGQDPALAKRKIDSLYALLEAGADFGQLAMDHSEDKRTAGNKGYLGFFGIKRYELPFEEAAFSIEQDSACAEPVETSAGWHIIQRISRKGIQPFPVARRRLEAAIKRDSRYAQAQDALVEQIKTEGNYTLQEKVLTDYVASLPDTFLTYRWKPVDSGNEKTLFQLGDRQVKLEEFKSYLLKSARQRLALSGKQSSTEAGRALYKDFLRDYCLKYEEGRLNEKYPEFKALMREYEEGILLFEAARILVWDKAAQDTAGLEAFYESEKGKYRWEERVRLTRFSFDQTPSAEWLENVRQAAAKLPEEDLFDQFGSDEEELNLSTELLEKSSREEIPGLKWEVGSLTKPFSPEKGKMVFYRVEEILPPADKKLDEARGYIIADYQDQLEKEWINRLRSEYQVEVDQKVFESLIGKQKPAQPE